MNSKKTKGNKKITINRIVKYEARMTALCRRRNSVYTKLDEFSALNDADIEFLMYTDIGILDMLNSPSFEPMVDQFLNSGDSDGSSSSLIVNVAQYRENIKKLCETYNNMVEKLKMEEKKKAETTARLLSMEENAWWKVDHEEMKRMLEILLEEIIDQRAEE